LPALVFGQLAMIVHEFQTILKIHSEGRSEEICMQKIMPLLKFGKSSVRKERRARNFARFDGR
jgi:hypothetical protein